MRLSLNYIKTGVRISSVNDLIPLTLLRTGDAAEIGQLVGAADHVHRLEELGLRGGTHVEMVQSGSPCIIRLGGSRLCFRANEMFSVLVRPRVAG